MAPRVTVIVPTRDRPEQLGHCLAALAAQTVDAAELEVLAVQDAEGAGPGAARLRGAALAQAPILCFTDDDCEPDPGWAAALEQALLAGADAAVGRTVNAVQNNRFSQASQLVVTHLMERQAGYGTANNMAVRAEALREVPFDTRFRFAGGDRDWAVRLRSAGKRVAFVPDAVVRHRHDLSAADFVRQQFAYGRGAYAFRRRHAAPVRREAPSLYVSLLARAWRAGPAMGLLVAASQVVTAAGYAVAAASDRNRRRLG